MKRRSETDQALPSRRDGKGVAIGKPFHRGAIFC
jgi:hypothetical protein